MNPITAETITLEATRLQAVCDQYFKRWEVPLVGVRIGALPPSNTKAEYGQASSKGEVIISENYIGTSFLDALRATIIHEFTHLILGFSIGHNAQFRKILSGLLYRAEVDEKLAADQKTALTESLTKRPQYMLVAILKTGREVEVQAAYKKSKKYLDYNPDLRRLLIDGILISHFEYRSNAS